MLSPPTLPSFIPARITFSLYITSHASVILLVFQSPFHSTWLLIDPELQVSCCPTPNNPQISYPSDLPPCLPHQWEFPQSPLISDKVHLLFHLTLVSWEFLPIFSNLLFISAKILPCSLTRLVPDTYPFNNFVYLYILSLSTGIFQFTKTNKQEKKNPLLFAQA